LHVEFVRAAEEIRETRVERHGLGFAEWTDRDDAESGPVPFTRSAGEREQPLYDFCFGQASVLHELQHLLVEFSHGTAGADQCRPQIPPAFFARVVGHLAVTPAAEQTAPDLVQM